MAVKTKAPPAKKDTKTPEPAAKADQKQEKSGVSSRYAGIIKAVSRYGLMSTLGVSLVANGIALARLRSTDTPVAQLTPEVLLGQFGFVSSQAEAGQVIEAEFSVHVALSEDAEEAGRQRLTEREFRLQQDVEELLRGAHSGDFDDPLLKDLKQQLKERINKTLGIRAAAYVIITQLETQRKDFPPLEDEGPAGLVPWVEPTGK